MVGRSRFLEGFTVNDPGRAVNEAGAMTV
jgi:hypothetical protein